MEKEVLIQWLVDIRGMLYGEPEPQDLEEAKRMLDYVIDSLKEE